MPNKTVVVTNELRRLKGPIALEVPGTRYVLPAFCIHLAERFSGYSPDGWPYFVPEPDPDGMVHPENAMGQELLIFFMPTVLGLRQGQRAASAVIEHLVGGGVLDAEVILQCISDSTAWIDTGVIFPCLADWNHSYDVENT